MPNEPTSTANAPHYTWGEGCDGWHLLKTDALSIIEERMPPGSSERRHFHDRARQFFYVLAGELTMEIDGREHVILAHNGLEIDPGVPHQAMNHSDADVRFIVTSQPPSHGDRTNL
jgi:mannose-6-phosphate isomerase-like protein (cupin superfamily)